MAPSVKPFGVTMNTFCRRLFTVCVFLCALRGYAAIPSARAGSPKYIRVLIMQGLPSLGLKVSGAYQIQDAKSRQVLYRGRDIKATVTQAKGRIWLGPKGCDTDRLLLSASDNNVILNGRRFRGDALIIKEKDNTFSVVNYIGLEDYVKGVLYHEVSHYWPQEALKAQAVASRTFAFYQAQENAAKDFDVTCDFYSQMYGGRAAERYRTSFAVEVTKGEILVYEGKVFPAYFHATCAGHTEDASLLWDTDLPVLKGVVCNFCKDSPHFKWHYVVSLKGLQEALKKSGYVFTQITSITVLGRDMSGRVTNVRISDQLHSADVAAKDLRSVIGPKLLRSTNFKIGISGDDAVFEGFGWGHGVGLCQWGAYFMAKEGYTYQEILQFYYPGSTRTLAEENQ